MNGPPPSSGTHVRVVAPGGPRIVLLADLLRRFGAADLVRLHERDFTALRGMGRDLVHFNLGRTTNAAGRRFAIVPIVTSGWRDADGGEVLPVIDPDRFRLATCLDVTRGLSLELIPPDFFRDSLPGLTTAAQLQAALIERYRPLLPGTRPDAIMARGCTATRFRLDPDGSQRPEDAGRSPQVGDRPR